MKITGAYLSPSVTRAGLLPLLYMVITDGTGRDVLIGDLNARHSSWDRNTNTKERAICTRTADTRHRSMAPDGCTYRPR